MRNRLVGLRLFGRDCLTLEKQMPEMKVYFLGQPNVPADVLVKLLDPLIEL